MEITITTATMRVALRITSNPVSAATGGIGIGIVPGMVLQFAAAI
jgi:hypothetical protein